MKILNSCFNFNNRATGNSCSCENNCSCVRLSCTNNSRNSTGFSTGCNCNSSCIGCGCGSNCGTGNSCNNGCNDGCGCTDSNCCDTTCGPSGLASYVSYVGTLGTVTTGTTLPITPVVTEGESVNTSGTSVVLAPGDYEIIYTFSGTLAATDTFFTVTPVVNGSSQTQYSTTYSNGSEVITTNTVSRAFIVSSASTSTLYFVLTTDAADGVTDVNFTVTVKKLDEE